MPSDGDRDAEYDVGADAFISKPIDFELLDTRIKALLAKSKRQSLTALRRLRVALHEHEHFLWFLDSLHPVKPERFRQRFDVSREFNRH